MVKSVPTPLRLTVWVLPATPLLLSVMVSAPVRVPLAVGVKVTLIMQLAPAARLPPQLLVWAKSPLVAMLEMVSGPVPVLERVTFCAALAVPRFWLPKLRVPGETLTAGAVPVPLRLTVWVLPLVPPLSSVKVKVPVRGPAEAGVKVTDSVQLAPTARGEAVTQLEVVEKLLVAATLETCRDALPLLVTVTA